MKDRIWALDFVKAVAITAVVLGHIATPLSGFIYAWHMPVFFILSGVLMAVHDENKGIDCSIISKKEFCYLGKFFLWFRMIEIVIGGLKTVFIKQNDFDWYGAVHGFLLYGDYAHMSTHYGFVLWFLPALFWGKVFARFFLKYLSVLPASLLAVIVAFLAVRFTMPSYLSIRGGLISLLFIYIGYRLWKLRDQWTVKGAKLGVLIVMMLFLPVVPLSMGGYRIPNIYCAIYAIMMFITLYGIGMHVDRVETKFKNCIVFLAKNSIYIMVFHVYTNNIFYVLTQKLSLPWPIEFILSMSSLVVCINLKDRINISNGASHNNE